MTLVQGLAMASRQLTDLQKLNITLTELGQEAQGIYCNQWDYALRERTTLDINQLIKNVPAEVLLMAQ